MRLTCYSKWWNQNDIIVFWTSAIQVKSVIAPENTNK